MAVSLWEASCARSEGAEPRINMAAKGQAAFRVVIMCAFGDIGNLLAGAELTTRRSFCQGEGGGDDLRLLILSRRVCCSITDRMVWAAMNILMNISPVKRASA